MSTCKLLGDEENCTLSSYDEESSQCSVRSLLREELEEECIATSRYCSGCIGFVVGIFIQGSTLGLNFLLAEFGRASEKNSVPGLNAYIALTAGWTIVASTLATAVLFLLRSLVVTSFYSTNTIDSEEVRVKERFMLRVIKTMERCTAVGAVCGVALAWAFTDTLMGVQSCVLHSSLTIVVAVLWYASFYR